LALLFPEKFSLTVNISYILNRGWIDRSAGHVPTYGEITAPGEERQKKKGKAKAEPEDDSELDGENRGNLDDEMDTSLHSDASFESLASHFEASYNHRFEEPGAATIAAFPHILPSVLRRQDTTRKEARERRIHRLDHVMLDDISSHRHLQHILSDYQVCYKVNIRPC
jgi:protein KRI1